MMGQDSTSADDDLDAVAQLEITMRDATKAAAAKTAARRKQKRSSKKTPSAASAPPPTTSHMKKPSAAIVPATAAVPLKRPAAFKKPASCTAGNIDGLLVSELMVFNPDDQQRTEKQLTSKIYHQAKSKALKLGKSKDVTASFARLAMSSAVDLWEDNQP